MHSSWIHLCIDMQRMFAEDTPWHVEWMAKISPAVVAVTDRYPEKTIFTRFVPPRHAAEMPGAWRAYYRKWEDMTLDRMNVDLVDIVPDLKRFTPPARVFDKRTYSPWIDGRLHQALQIEGIDTVVLSGGETDVCVLAAALGAIDLGYHVKLLKDAVCSGADGTHDASLAVLGDRFSLQLEVTDSDAFLSKASAAH